MLSLERVIQELRQQVDGQAYRQQAAHHDETSQRNSTIADGPGQYPPPPFKPYFDDESVGIESLWKRLTALRTYYNRYPSQRQYDL